MVCLSRRPRTINATHHLSVCVCVCVCVYVLCVCRQTRSCSLRAKGMPVTSPPNHNFHPSLVCMYCMYVCVYVCMANHAHIFHYLCMYVCMHIHTHNITHTNTHHCTCWYVNLEGSFRICILPHMHAYTYIHIKWKCAPLCLLDCWWSLLLFMHAYTYIHILWKYIMHLLVCWGTLLIYACMYVCIHIHTYNTTYTPLYLLACWGSRLLWSPHRAKWPE
jgi:hypothetical protein